jgi:hypothetical protein
MTIKKIRILFLLVLVLILTQGRARADYMAKQFITIINGDFGRSRNIFESKLYTKGKKLRMEITMQGRRSIAISRGDKKPPVFWVLMPEEKMYRETENQEGISGHISNSTKREYEKVFVAKEYVAGIMTNKFKLAWKGEDGQRRTGMAWEAIDLNNAPVRQEFFNRDEHVLIQLANVKVKELDLSLFEIPEGYKKISIPDELKKK